MRRSSCRSSCLLGTAAALDRLDGDRSAARTSRSRCRPPGWHRSVRSGSLVSLSAPRLAVARVRAGPAPPSPSRATRRSARAPPGPSSPLDAHALPVEIVVSIVRHGVAVGVAPRALCAARPLSSAPPPSRAVAGRGAASSCPPPAWRRGQSARGHRLAVTADGVPLGEPDEHATCSSVTTAGASSGVASGAAKAFHGDDFRWRCRLRSPLRCRR